MSFLYNSLSWLFFSKKKINEIIEEEDDTLDIIEKEPKNIITHESINKIKKENLDNNSYNTCNLGSCFKYFLACKNSKFYYLSLIREDNTWKIHGLWPQYNFNKYPTYCKDIPFNLENIKSLLPELKEKWISNDGDDESFWKHEWDKHGTCMFHHINEFLYFKTTLKLYNDLMSNKNFAIIINKHKDKNNNKCLIPYNTDFKRINYFI